MYSRQILERKLLLLTILWLAIMSLPVAGAQNRITFRMDYICGRAAMIIWSPFILDELSGLRRDQPVVPDIAKGESGFLARNPGFVTIICGPKGAAQYGQINYLGITRDADKVTRESYSFSSSSFIILRSLSNAIRS